MVAYTTANNSEVNTCFYLRNRRKCCCC